MDYTTLKHFKWDFDIIDNINTPIGMLIDIGNPEQIVIKYIYKQAESEECIPNKFDSFFRTKIELGKVSNRIMKICISLEEGIDPVLLLISDLLKFKKHNEYTRFFINHDLVFKGTTQIFN